MLTGLISPDTIWGTDRGALVYGHNIQNEMDQVRHSMGVCPQHDVLFEKLTVREHILFFAQLKGKISVSTIAFEIVFIISIICSGVSYEDASQEAETLTNLFHLDQRLDHLGEELSGGQKRKLSVAIAVCGKSTFVVLDEPTAGNFHSPSL